ncbi:MAG: zinc-binding dehydrogenase [Thermoplasmata archaeon]|nr:MAG: zinc-binding dehydrogenase [Thermoplasmata archaeon]
MKAAVFHSKNEPLKIEEVPVPEYKADEVLVKVAGCGLCRTDLHYLKGLPTFKKPPIILGHEISGTIAETGDNVSTFEKGDPVLIPPVFACAECFFCRTGRGTICTNQVMVGNHRDGGFAEYIAVPGSDIFKLPPEVPLVEGSIISDAISTPYHAVVNRAQIKPGDSAVVYGCGGVGLNTVQMATVAGANVIAVDIAPEKLELAKKLGAVETLNANDQEDVAKAVRKLSSGGVDVAFEVIGNPETIQNAYESTRWGGTLIVVGYTHKDITINAGRMMFREIEVKGSLGCGLQDYPKIINMVKYGKIKVKELVTHKFTLDQINDGFELLGKNEPTLIRAVAMIE